MAKALVNIMIVCLIFYILSIVMTSGNDDIAKAKAEAEAAAAEAEAAVAKAKAAAEAAAAAEAEAEVEEPDTSLLSFSTSAALSSDDDFIAPDISAGKVPVNCVIGGWEDIGGCDKDTGIQKQKRRITPAKNSGTCEVSADKIDGEGYENRDKDCDVDCEVSGWIGGGEGWSSCSKTCGGGTRTRTRTITQEKRNNGEDCPTTLEESEDCNTDLCCTPVFDVIESESICDRACTGGPYVCGFNPRSDTPTCVKTVKNSCTEAITTQYDKGGFCEGDRNKGWSCPGDTREPKKPSPPTSGGSGAWGQTQFSR
jgi:hypothetical protein